MATVKISELSSSANITSDDFFPIVDSSVTKKVTAALMKDFVLGRSGSNDTIHISSSDALKISANTGIGIAGNTAVTGSVTSTQGFTGSLSGTATSASFAPTVLPTGTVSSSAQIDYNSIQNKPSTIATASFATTASYAANVTTLSRATISSNIPSVTANQNYTGSIANFGKSFMLFSTTVNTHSRIRLYGSQSFGTNDLSRSIGTDPSQNSGVIMDLVLSGSPSLFNYIMSPIVNGANMDPTPMSTIYYTVTNLSGVTSDISMSFNRLVLE